MHALTVRQTQNHEAPRRRQPGVSSWAPLMLIASWMLLATKRCVSAGEEEEGKTRWFKFNVGVWISEHWRHRASYDMHRHGATSSNLHTQLYWW